MPHPLDPLLRPASIALVGASERDGSFGHGMIGACLEAGFSGEVHLVNPQYDRIGDLPCYPDLAGLPATPDHAVLMIANARIEAVLADAIAAGVRAVTMFCSAQLDDGQPTALADRLRAMAQEAGVLICGANGSGFYNRVDRVRCQMGGRGQDRPGNVTLISQSGSIYTALAENDGRLRYNLTVSSGQELTTDVTDYMDFALAQPETRAIGLYIETIRRPERFVCLLQRAAAMDVPVVALKVARSERGKAFALSHTGALAGDAEVYHAVLDSNGALSVDDPDELVASLQLLSTGRRATRPGIVAITDSGGERELLVDIAEAEGVRFAEIGSDTIARIGARIEYGLVPENPLDAWGTGRDFEGIFRDSMAALMADDAAGMGVWVSDLRDMAGHSAAFARAAVAVAAQTSKPLAIATCFSKGRNELLANALADDGVPVLEGMRPALVAVRNMLAYCGRDRRPAPPAIAPAPHARAWRDRLATGHPLSEAEGLTLLSDFGIPVVTHRTATSAREAEAAARDLGFPVALKTMAPGIAHKSERNGVKLGLATPQAVCAAYDEVSRGLGPCVIVQEMVPQGLELSMGCFRDPQFGPVVALGAGGVLIELLRDTQFGIPPLERADARRMIDRLALRRLLDGYRGAPACDLHALADVFTAFSRMVLDLGEALVEIDVNPLIVTDRGVIAVDALILPAPLSQPVAEVAHV